MISFDNAQVYFRGGNHHKSSVWAGFGQTHRLGAVATAKRVLSRALGRAMQEDEPPYKAGDRRRDEYAVYEQALWMLEHGQIANAMGADPVPILTGQADVAGGADGPVALWAPEALRWLGWTGAAVIRG